MSDEVMQAVETVLTVQETKEEGTITLSNGVVVRPKRMPTAMLQRLWIQFPSPKPPIKEFESAGGRKWREPNPQDPLYLAEVEERSAKLSDSFAKLVFLKAMEIVSLPEGMANFEEDDEWMEELELLGIELPTSTLARRMEWIRYRIVPTTEDYELVYNSATALAGVSEEDIEAAQDRFPDNS